ncbi:uncharacterized protein I303_100325 [Kwoniella dejecticola CBS 10117]|uniref:DFDF domain-containing protein n=1 Tax=Kwoniella dejecticola CBS 10117 TaxID=1296121 RepID=A0A1A6AEN8_9TREE|nr:uncharacterized protein I303_00326 [Kwoniella dejecticola CBS 10117]OBR88509.1 hypothetical protein I303_00326 [Kwoniella dejecticola CBS 10117]
MAVDYSQFKGKPFQVISKLGVRYTGIFDHINQDDQTICLAQVYNHGTEDRPTARKLPGSNKSLGWVRFHTESIESLALVENYIPPGEEAPVDPILASVSQNAPPAVQPQAPVQPPPPPPTAPVASSSQPRKHSFDLPPKPTGAAISAATALDRVQRSLGDLHVEEPRQPRRGPPRQPIEVPDEEFDFAANNEKFKKEREAHPENGEESEQNGQNGQAEVGEPDSQPHPDALKAASPNPDDKKPPAAKYNKSSFFDNLSTGTAKVSRADERHRNFDTFGEAGGPSFQNQQGGFRGRGRGGNYNQGGRGGYGNQPEGGFRNGPGAGRGGYNQNQYPSRGGGRGGFGQQNQGFVHYGNSQGQRQQQRRDQETFQ